MTAKTLKVSIFFKENQFLGFSIFMLYSTHEDLSIDVAIN